MCIHRYRVFARFGLMHMMATNICVWLRTIIMETIRDVEIHTRSSDSTINGLDVLSHMFGHNNGTSRTTSTTTTTTASPQSHEYHVYGEHMNNTGMYFLLQIMSFSYHSLHFQGFQQQGASVGILEAPCQQPCKTTSFPVRNKSVGFKLSSKMMRNIWEF